MKVCIEIVVAVETRCEVVPETQAVTELVMHDCAQERLLHSNRRFTNRPTSEELGPIIPEPRLESVIEGRIHVEGSEHVPPLFFMLDTRKKVLTERRKLIEKVGISRRAI